MGRILATTSGKGGVGKSTTAVGLAMAFCKMGQNVLLVDMDRGLGCIDLMLGMDESAIMNLDDVLNGTPVEDAAYTCKEENLKLITAPKNAVEHNAFKQFAKDAARLFDIVIFDFPAGLEFELYTLLPATTLFLTVAIPEPVSVRDAAAVSFRLYELGLKSRLIINRFSLKRVKQSKQKSIDGIIDSAELRLLGLIPESKELNRLSLKHTIKKRCGGMQALLRIAARLCDEDIPLPNPKKI